MPPEQAKDSRERPNQPQRLRRGSKPSLIVSVVRDGTAAISNDVSNYVQLTEREWRWLIEEAGPKVLATFEATP